MNATDRLLTTRQVADRFGLSPETVLRWVRRGQLPAFRLGGAIRFREQELDAWLEQRATPRRGVLTATPDAARQAPYPLPSGPLTATEDEEY
jgi:excisionase family DNA binding protein